MNIEIMPTSDQTLDEILNLAAAHFKVSREKSFLPTTISSRLSESTACKRSTC